MSADDRFHGAAEWRQFLAIEHEPELTEKQQALYVVEARVADVAHILRLLVKRAPRPFRAELIAVVKTLQAMQAGMLAAAEHRDEVAEVSS